MQEYMRQYSREIKLMPSVLLNGDNKVIWLSYLMNVYYNAVRYMIDNKQHAMRACQVDCDWDFVNIDFVSWLKILDTSIISVIHSQKIKVFEECRRATCMQFMLTQMLVVVSELFCLKYRYVRDVEMNNGDMSAVVIHWKNHYHPKTVLKNNDFIKWVFHHYQSTYTFTFVDHLLPETTPRAISAFDQASANFFYTHILFN